MKKFIGVLLVLLCLCGCNSKPEEVQYTYDIKSSSVDMSAYEGVSSTNHNFRLITPTEFFNAYDAKSSGIFYLGRDNCACCQKVCRYLSETAKEMNVTVYYIDVYNKEEPLTDPDLQDKLYEYMYPILGSDNGEKALLTPEVFSLINGKYGGSQICYDNYELDYNPTNEQIEKFKDSYRKIFKPFVEDN